MPLQDEDAQQPSLAKDPLWWHCGTPFGICEGGVHEAAIVENAWQFLSWLMARPEQDIAVVSHSIFLLALFHGALDSAPGGGKHKSVELFHTGELRSVSIAETMPQEGLGACLGRWATALTVAGLQPTDAGVGVAKCSPTTRTSRSRSPKRSSNSEHEHDQGVLIREETDHCE